MDGICTALCKREHTPQQAHAAFMERWFAGDLIDRIIRWKTAGKPVAR